MAKVFLTNSNNDLYLNAAKGLAFTNKNIEVAAQLAKNYLWTFLTEIFTNQALGTDYFGIIFSEFSSLQQRLDEIIRVLETVPFVEKVESIGYTQDRESGVITLNPTIKTTYGSITVNNIGVG